MIADISYFWLGLNKTPCIVATNPGEKETLTFLGQLSLNICLFKNLHEIRSEQASSGSSSFFGQILLFSAVFVD